jgi:hypothetical protein
VRGLLKEQERISTLSGMMRHRSTSMIKMGIKGFNTRKSLLLHAYNASERCIESGRLSPSLRCGISQIRIKSKTKWCLPKTAMLNKGDCFWEHVAAHSPSQCIRTKKRISKRLHSSPPIRHAPTPNSRMS